MTAVAHYKARQRWCTAGQRFAAKHATLNSAWRACQDGRLMAYWLTVVLDEGMSNDKDIWTKLVQLRQSLGLDYMFTDGTVDQHKQFATLIRAAFNSDGSRRKRKAR